MESMPAPQQNCCGRNHQSAPIRTAFHKKVNLIVAPVSKRKSPSAKLKRVTFKLMILPLSPFQVLSKIPGAQVTKA